MAERFTADEITPFAAEWDEPHVSRETIAKRANSASAAIYVR